MGELFDIAYKYFTDDEWYFVQLDSRPVLQMSYQGSNGKWTCYADANDEKHTFCFYSVCPINIPEEFRQSAAEYIARANYGLRIGNFELDFNDGEVRFKTSIDVENDRLVAPLIGNLVAANLWTMDR